MRSAQRLQLDECQWSALRLGCLLCLFLACMRLFLTHLVAVLHSPLATAIATATATATITAAVVAAAAAAAGDCYYCDLWVVSAFDKHCESFMEICNAAPKPQPGAKREANA